MSSVSSPELLFSDRCGGTSCLQATQVQCRGNIGSHEVLVWVLWGNEECEINSVSVSERVERQVWLRYGYLPSHQVLTQGRCRRIINTFVQSKARDAPVEKHKRRIPEYQPCPFRATVLNPSHEPSIALVLSGVPTARQNQKLSHLPKQKSSQCVSPSRRTEIKHIKFISRAGRKKTKSAHP